MKSKCGHLGRMTRGVCARCYAELCRRVKRKETTWKELEDQGKVNAPQKPKPMFFGRRS